MPPIYSCRQPSSPGPIQGLRPPPNTALHAGWGGSRNPDCTADLDPTSSHTPHPTPRGSGPSPTTEATPARPLGPLLLIRSSQNGGAPSSSEISARPLLAPGCCLIRHRPPRPALWTSGQPARVRSYPGRPALPPPPPVLTAPPKSPPGLTPLLCPSLTRRSPTPPRSPPLRMAAAAAPPPHKMARV